jgi:DNA replicative helicase MCM subunit Mcm2 (Cdc46/Mcm family)
MSAKEQQYLEAHNAWIKARDKYKSRLNNLARQLASGQMNTDERGFEWHFNYVYNLYHPYAKRYLEALRLYAQEPPELKGRLMQDYLQEASIAQSQNRNEISDSYLHSVEKLAVESAKVAYSDWVRKGNVDTMGAVFVSIADAQMLNADSDPEVKKIALEVFEHFQQGKVKRDPEKIPVKLAPEVPSAKRRPGPSLWIQRTIKY